MHKFTIIWRHSDLVSLWEPDIYEQEIPAQSAEQAVLLWEQYWGIKKKECVQFTITTTRL